MDNKIVDSKVYSLKELFSDKFDVDFIKENMYGKKTNGRFNNGSILGVSKKLENRRSFK